MQPTEDVSEASQAGAEGPDDAVARSRALPLRTQNVSALQVAFTQLRRHLTAWMRHEPGARSGNDPEELHQLRVSARRIEATLALFKHQISPRLLQARTGAKSVLRNLGAVRDFDVQLAQLERYCADLAQGERNAAAPLRARLEAERARARSRMIRALDTEATRHWLESLSLASADFSPADEPGAARAAPVMAQRVRNRFKKLKKDVRRLNANSTMDDYHAVRRRGKQLRYALECGAGLFGKPGEEMLKALRRLQDGLGAHQDAHMAKNRLAAIAADRDASLPAETVFLMGRMAEHHLEETAQARRTLARAWRKVSGKRWKALRARMKDLSEPSPTAPPAAQGSTPLPESPPPPSSEPEPVSATLPRPLRH